MEVQLVTNEMWIIIVTTIYYIPYARYCTMNFTMEPHLIYIINEISIFSCLQMKEIEVN